VEAPAGFIDQAAARDKADNVMQNRQWGGLLVLTALRFDIAAAMSRAGSARLVMTASSFDVYLRRQAVALWPTTYGLRQGLDQFQHRTPP
jgi:hypothetical protein